MFLGKQEVKVLEQRPTLTQIEYASGNICWVKNESLSKSPSTVKKTTVYNHVVPSALSSVFLETLEAVKEKIEIRVHYPKHAEANTLDTFSKAGVALPTDIRPLNSGSRGGQTTQRDWAAVVWFPKTPFAPEGSKQDPNRLHMMMNSRRDVVLAIVKAGFPITDYAHEEG